MIELNPFCQLMGQWLSWTLSANWWDNDWVEPFLSADGTMIELNPICQLMGQWLSWTLSANWWDSDWVEPYLPTDGTMIELNSFNPNSTHQPPFCGAAVKSSLRKWSFDLTLKHKSKQSRRILFLIFFKKLLVLSMCFWKMNFVKTCMLMTCTYRRLKRVRWRMGQSYCAYSNLEGLYSLTTVLPQGW